MYISRFSCKGRVSRPAATLTMTGALLACLLTAVVRAAPAEVLRYHPLVVDEQGKILPWFKPVDHAFDNYLRQCWAWALAAPLDPRGLPISYLYCAWSPGDPPHLSAGWENDVGEKIPNWLESARLFYQYTGDRAPLEYVRRLVDYSLEHGQTPKDHAWPDFPVGTANAGDAEFRGFTGPWVQWDCHVDLAADIGWSMARLYQLTGEAKYRDKALHVADLLAQHIVPGTEEDSPWPYVINSKTGENHSRYAASWDGALNLFDILIANRLGRVADYERARSMLKAWLLAVPMRNGTWVDGHSDNKIDGTSNLSTTCASDMCLYLFEHPEWDPDFLKDVPRLLQWTEEHFVNQPTPDKLPGWYHGAAVPAEQSGYAYRMGYQAARLGAQYACWYAVSGDAKYKDQGYRCLAYNTYMMRENGQSSDGPTDEVGFWWSDCYGEATRMYYYAMAAVPEWAPPDENHLLGTSSVVTSITYAESGITYSTFDPVATEVFRLVSKPASVLADGKKLPRRPDLKAPGWQYDPASGVLRVRHEGAKQIRVAYDRPSRPAAAPPAPGPPPVGEA